MANIEIRRRTERDLPVVVRTLREVHERDGYPAGWLTPSDMVEAWVAVANGVVVGHALLEIASPESPGRLGEGEVGRLFSAVDARGLGAGLRLLETVVTGARLRGLRPVLCVDSAARAAIGLYESAGWTRTDTFPVTWTRTDGSSVAMHRYVLADPASMPQSQTTRRGVRAAQWERRPARFDR